MLKYGKTSQHAIMAMSFLAESFDQGVTRFTSGDIAKARALPQPIVAKLLVVLSQSGLIEGAPGPKGGYWLSRDPSEISLYDIVSQFERMGERISCPLGTDRCNEETPCALHTQLLDLDRQLIGFLKDNRMDRFHTQALEPASV